MKKATNVLLKIFRATSFLIYYIKEMILANLLIARDILFPRAVLTPGILKLKLDCASDHEILTFFNLLTMTPGSLSIDISDDKKYLYVHLWNVNDIPAMKEEIKKTLEKRVLEVYR